MQNYFIILKKLWILYKPFHKHFYIQVALVFLYQVLSISTSVINSHLINSLVANSVSIAITFFLAWVVIVILMNISFYFQNRLQERNLNQPIGQFLQEHSLTKILDLTIGQHIEDHSAIKEYVITQGENAATSILNTIFTNIIPTILYTFVALITLTYYSVILGAISLLVLVLLFYWAYVFRKFHSPYVAKNRDNWAKNKKIRMEAFTHLPLAKYFSRENFFIKKYIDQRAVLVEHHLATRELAFTHTLRRSNFQDVAELVSLGIAAILFMKGGFAIGTLYLVLNVSSRVYWNINSFSSVLRDLPLWFLEVEKYLEATEKEPSFVESGKKLDSYDGVIKFDNVTFKYPHSTSNILENVSFTIEKNKVTAIVGSSGSGKSTITKLLLRAYTYTVGSIILGDTELKDLDTTRLRNSIGYVEQHVDLLDESVKQNILFGVSKDDKAISEERLEEIAHLARIDQFYHRLGEKKFDTIVGERGIKLSGGERQRIGIARAIIKNPDILIFDEATSSLDTENEAKVMEAINDVSKGKTTIIIAHRLSTVRNADKIIVMDKGKVVGEGTHDELMQSNEMYQNLVAHQV